jgi:hypothetical protein
MAIVQHYRRAHGIVTQLRSVSNIHACFPFIGIDQEMRNRVPGLTEFLEEI